MLAIVIPYYKKTFFRQTLQALANQTDKRFHVYIGNDASPDDPVDLIKQFEHKLNLTYIRFENNLGKQSLVKQWKRCLNLNRNESWVTILGDDDTYAPNVVEDFYNNLNEGKIGKSLVVRFSTFVINETDQIISAQYKHPTRETATDFLIRKFKGGTRSSLSEYFFRNDVVQQVQFKDFPLAWSSDILAVIEFSRDQEIFTINNATVNFRISKENISGKGDSIEKNEAWFMFYSYLLLKYGNSYSNELVEMLINRLEKVQMNNKTRLTRWIKLVNIYIQYKTYDRFFSLPRKIIKSIK